MKKIGFIILLTLSFLLLTNCNKNENKNPKIKFSDDTYKLFEEFTENKKDIIKKLKTLNKEEANIYTLEPEYISKSRAEKHF